MAISGLIVAHLPAGTGMVWLAVDNGLVVDACQKLRPRALGGCARQAWRELYRQSVKMWWIPSDLRQQQPVCRTPRRNASTAMARLRRAHANLRLPASAAAAAA